MFGQLSRSPKHLGRCFGPVQQGEVSGANPGQDIEIISLVSIMWPGSVCVEKLVQVARKKES